MFHVGNSLLDFLIPNFSNLSRVFSKIKVAVSSLEFTPKIPVTCPSWQPSPDHIFPSVDVAATAVASADSIVLICLSLLAMISFWRSCKNSICFISRIILVPRPPQLVCQLSTVSSEPPSSSPSVSPLCQKLLLTSSAIALTLSIRSRIDFALERILSRPNQ